MCNSLGHVMMYAGACQGGQGQCDGHNCQIGGGPGVCGGVKKVQGRGQCFLSSLFTHINIHTSVMCRFVKPRPE